MYIRSQWFLLAMLLIVSGHRAATGSEASGASPGTVGESPIAPGSATPPATMPVPADAIGTTIKDASCPEGGVTAAEPYPKSRRIPLEASWEDGLRLDSTDDQFHLHIGGIAQIDTVGLIGPQSVFALPGGGSNGVGNSQATQLRRAVLQADGAIFDQFDYMLQYDFANASNDNSGLQPPSFGNLTSSPAPHNIWMQVRDVPFLGNVRVGNQYKPIGMANNTSGAFLPFMERPDVHDAFYAPFDNGFALGITAENWTESERLTWRYGVFQPATNVFGVALNKYTLGARITALPWYEDDGGRLVHVGLGYWGGEIVQDELRDRARPLLRNAPGFAVPVLVDTGEVPGSKQYTIGPEFAMALGPFSVQAEFAGQWFTNATPTGGLGQGTVFYYGWYIEALYFLTGEHPAYDTRKAVFGRVIPRNDYDWKKGDVCRGFGAWQVGVRFSYVNLDDKAIQGGQVYDWSAGLNWYLNADMKVQLNYIAEHRDTPGVTPNWINGVGLRASYDF